MSPRINLTRESGKETQNFYIETYQRLGGASITPKRDKKKNPLFLSQRGYVSGCADCGLCGGDSGIVVGGRRKPTNAGQSVGGGRVGPWRGGGGLDLKGVDVDTSGSHRPTE